MGVGTGGGTASPGGSAAERRGQGELNAPDDQSGNVGDKILTMVSYAMVKELMMGRTF